MPSAKEDIFCCATQQTLSAVWYRRQCLLRGTADVVGGLAQQMRILYASKWLSTWLRLNRVVDSINAITLRKSIAILSFLFIQDQQTEAEKTTNIGNTDDSPIKLVHCLFSSRV